MRVKHRECVAKVENGMIVGQGSIITLLEMSYFSFNLSIKVGNGATEKL